MLCKKKDIRSCKFKKKVGNHDIFLCTSSDISCIKKFTNHIDSYHKTP